MACNIQPRGPLYEDIQVTLLTTVDCAFIIWWGAAEKSGRWILGDDKGRVWAVPMNLDGSFSTDPLQWDQMYTEGEWVGR